MAHVSRKVGVEVTLRCDLDREDKKTRRKKPCLGREAGMPP